MKEQGENSFFNLPVRILLLAVCAYIFLGLAGGHNSRHATFSDRNKVSIYQDIKLSSAETPVFATSQNSFDLSSPEIKVKPLVYDQKQFLLNSHRNTLQKLEVQDAACLSFVTFSGYFLLPGYIPDTGKDLPDLG